MRIVSLLPSATEIICSIGLREDLVGVTHECDYPPSVQGLPIITSTLIPKGLSSAEIDGVVREQLSTEKALYTLREDRLRDLRPDLIVSQALCDVCAVAASEVEAVATALESPPQIVNLEPARLEEVFQTIAAVAAASGRPADGDRLLERLRSQVAAVESRSAAILPENRPRVAMLEWLDPLFNAGHWTPELVAMAGGIDCLGNLFEPSVRVDWDALAASDADVIFIALCGFNMARTLEDVAAISVTPEWQALKAVREGKVHVTDGNAYFSRSGPRLVDSLEILAHALHPQHHPLPTHLAPALKLSNCIP